MGAGFSNPSQNHHADSQRFRGGYAINVVNRCLLTCLLVLVLAASAWAGNGTASDAMEAQIKALMTVTATQQAEITALQNVINSTNAQNAFARGHFVTVSNATINGLIGPHIIFTGTNLHVQDGSGSTDDGGGTLTGLGNLIIGYDENPGATPTGYRGGAHNLVIGQSHAFTAFGGSVAGFGNTISGPNANVTGGEGNTASGDSSSVSGGVDNLASDVETSVSGGAYNTAGPTATVPCPILIGSAAASVSGGSANLASGRASSATGGFNNTASGPEATADGGLVNIASGNTSSVSGGNSNNASGDSSSATGGVSNLASGTDSSVKGGSANTASGINAAVGGSTAQTASATNQFLP